MDAGNIWIPLMLTFIAGLSTGVGSLISFFIRRQKKLYLHLSLGLSAGVMIYIAFMELLPSAVLNLGFMVANMAFFGGILFIMLLDFLIPHQYLSERVNMRGVDRKLMKAGLFTAIGIAIHNLPEGLAVFMSSIGDLSIGIALAIAIAMHNIPEGIAISVPILYATKSRKKAFFYSFFAGLAEPLGAVIGIIILLPYLTPAILSFILAFVAGIMVFISFDELLPICLHEDRSHLPVAALFLGMLVTALSLFLI